MARHYMATAWISHFSLQDRLDIVAVALCTKVMRWFAVGHAILQKNKPDVHLRGRLVHTFAYLHPMLQVEPRGL
jgi:hypothetical protein